MPSVFTLLDATIRSAIPVSQPKRPVRYSRKAPSSSKWRFARTRETYRSYRPIASKAATLALVSGIALTCAISITAYLKLSDAEEQMVFSPPRISNSSYVAGSNIRSLTITAVDAMSTADNTVSAQTTKTRRLYNLPSENENIPKVTVEPATESISDEEQDTTAAVETVEPSSASTIVSVDYSRPSSPPAYTTTPTHAPEPDETSPPVVIEYDPMIPELSDTLNNFLYSNREDMGTTFTDANGFKIPYKQKLEGAGTAYTAKPGALTASGAPVYYGGVAVNPDVIPLGSKLYIVSNDGRYVYGYATAIDTGGALYSGQALVDLFYWTERECFDFGRRAVTVYVL